MQAGEDAEQKTEMKKLVKETDAKSDDPYVEL